MSKLQVAIEAIVDVFMDFSDRDDKDRQLSKEEFKELIKNEMTKDLKDKFYHGDVEEVLYDIDKNKDGEINFREFSRCVADLALRYFRMVHGLDKQVGRWKSPR